MSLQKHCNYATIVYQSFAPSNWQHILRHLDDVNFEISSLHQHNMHPHYHVVLSFRSPTHIVNAIEICESFGGNGITIIDSVDSWKSFYKYLFKIRRG